jgi:hypothetical protein
MKIQTMAFMALFISIIETVIFSFQASISNFFYSFLISFFLGVGLLMDYRGKSKNCKKESRYSNSTSTL